MGLSIVLEGEFGNKLETITDERNLLNNVLLPQQDVKYYLLHFIDWYGDTIFNRLQMATLLKDLGTVYEKTEDTDTREIVKKVIQLCERCRDEVHLYVKFYGD